MVADTKKCQTLINLCAAECLAIKASHARLVAFRQAYQAQGVDPTGTPLEGHVGQVSAWIDAVGVVAADPVANGLIEAAVPSHRNKALGEVE
jgi:hypothetical protein